MTRYGNTNISDTYQQGWVIIMTKNIFTLVIASALFTTISSYSAQAMDFKRPSDAVELRQAQMSAISAYFGDMGAMVKRKKPFDAAQFKTNAERLAALASWSATGFEKETYISLDSETDRAVWTNKADFDKKMDEFAKAAEELKNVAAGGDLKESIPAFKAVASTCGGCHKPYKSWYFL